VFITNSISFGETFNILNTRKNENHHISRVEIYYERQFNCVCYHFPPSHSARFRFLNMTKICNFAGFSHFRCSYCETLYYIIFHAGKQTDIVLILLHFFFYYAIKNVKPYLLINERLKKMDSLSEYRVILNRE